MRFVLALLACLPPGAAFAACVPSQATKGMVGCQPIAPSVLGTDFIQTWIPGAFPNSLQIISVDTLFQGRSVNLTSPGPIGTVTPNTGAFTQMAANSLVIGSPAGGNMGAGSLNLTSLFINGVDVSSPQAFSVTNKGGTITLGGASQTLMAANSNRVGCSFQAQTGDLWFNTVGLSAGPVQPSRYLPAPSEWSCPPGFRGAITIYGATTGITFSGEEDTVP